MDSLTVCITNYKRPEYLRRAITSCKEAGITKLVISSMEPDDDVEKVISECSELGWTRYFVTRSIDLGVNESWLRAAYYADTKRVIILHDDDIVLPGLGKTYVELIKPALERGVGFASWRANLRYDDGKVQNTEYFSGPTRVLPSAELERFLLRRGRLSLSPIISVFDREVLINALKESDKVLVDKASYLHPSMLLGTEILAYLRHCSTHQRWLYVDQILSGYGAHGGSGTVQAEQAREIPKLAAGYDVARQYYEEKRRSPLPPEPRILLLHSDYQGGDEEEKARIHAARRTWQHHLDLNQMMELPVPDGSLPRSAKDIGDDKPYPFLRDLLDYGCKFAMPGDIVAYINSDLALTTEAHNAILQGVKTGGGVTVAWRRTMKFNPDRLYSTAKNGKWDGGVDLIAVTPEWWSCHSMMIPDVLIGREMWDWVARVYAEKFSNHKCYIDNHFYHYPHPSMLSRCGLSSPSQRHNLELAKKFFGAIGDKRAASIVAAQEKNAKR